ncbi:MAG: site-specific integrase [Halothiobacillus sp.]|nr:site-specific integrase [Halothiobacillus sp.]
MATITQRDNGKWQAKVRPKGHPAQSKTFLDQDDAKAWARAIETEQDRGIYIQRSHAEKTTLREVINRYRDEVVPTKKAQRQALSCLRGVEADLGGYALAAITPAVLANYRLRRLSIVDPQTVRKDLGMIQRLLKAAHLDWGIILPGGIPQVRMPKQPPGRERRVSAEEFAAIIEATESPELPAIVILAVETAMRRSEIVQTLCWSRIRFIDGGKAIAHLPTGETKNDEGRHVPLSTSATAALKRVPKRGDSDRVFSSAPDSITRAWVRARDRARKAYESRCAADGIPADPKFLVGARLHDVRHEATSRLFEMGVFSNIMEIAAITGHKDLASLKRYTHLRAEDLAAKLG